MRNPEDEREQETGSTSDEIKPEDGPLRYWMFINGEQARLFSGIAAGFFAVTWCFLYFFGFGSSVAGILLLGSAAACFVAWRMLDGQLRRYQSADWKNVRSPKVKRAELRIAIGLWLFIVLGVCTLFLWRRLGGR